MKLDAMSWTPAAVTERLRLRHEVSDSIFDAVYSDSIRRPSQRFWTPVSVALTASRWLAAAGCRDVLDVGSGPGKFCIIAQLALGIRVTGIEQRIRLVEEARAANSTYDARAVFLHGTLEAIDAERFDAFYLFNPFAENLFDNADRIDSDVELSEGRCFRDMALVERWLDSARKGVAVLTYHGFGGRIPNTYERVLAVPMGSDYLHLWIKKVAGRADGFFFELPGLVVSDGDLAAAASSLNESTEGVHLKNFLAQPLGAWVRSGD